MSPTVVPVTRPLKGTLDCVPEGLMDVVKGLVGVAMGVVKCCVVDDSLVVVESVLV